LSGFTVAAVGNESSPFRWYASYTSRDRKRWETGESVPDLETLAAIGAVCRVDPGWIAFGSASSAADPRDAMIKGESAVKLTRTPMRR